MKKAAGKKRKSAKSGDLGLTHKKRKSLSCQTEREKERERQKAK
jgi:hypothetical protein